MLIEVVYLTPDRTFLKEVELVPAATVNTAIVESGVLDVCPELNISTLQVGIYGKKTSLDGRLSDRDRVEIYRPLLIDPKQARRNRARRSS